MAIPQIKLFTYNNKDFTTTDLFSMFMNRMIEVETYAYTGIDKPFIFRNLECEIAEYSIYQDRVEMIVMDSSIDNFRTLELEETPGEIYIRINKELQVERRDNYDTHPKNIFELRDGEYSNDDDEFYDEDEEIDLIDEIDDLERNNGRMIDTDDMGAKYLRIIINFEELLSDKFNDDIDKVKNIRIKHKLFKELVIPAGRAVKNILNYILEDMTGEDVFAHAVLSEMLYEDADYQLNTAIATDAREIIINICESEEADYILDYADGREVDIFDIIKQQMPKIRMMNIKNKDYIARRYADSDSYEYTNDIKYVNRIKIDANISLFVRTDYIYNAWIMVK